MSLKAGIVGLPNVGKSTLFNAMTNYNVEAANYPFATIEPNVGIVALDDERLKQLATIVNPQKILPAVFEFVDIAGLVAGASKGEGLGNRFLANIRECDAIIHVVRCFTDPNITHVIGGALDPVRDMAVINLELLLADLETIDNVLRRVERKAVQTRQADLLAEMNLAQKIKAAFAKELPARTLTLSAEEQTLAMTWQLLTLKPMLYVANVAEEHVATPEQSALFMTVTNEAKRQRTPVIGISTQIEWELARLAPSDRQPFLDDLGIKASGLSRLARASFDLLGLATYFTAGVQEVRAWTFRKGMKAPQCAGIIHSDFERGFIKAEVIAYDDYYACGGEQGAKNAGKARLEGKDYIMHDGDVVHFKFNV